MRLLPLPVSLALLLGAVLVPRLQAQKPRPVEYYTVKSGQLLLVKNGQPSPAIEEVNLPDGAKLMTNGSITLKGGIKKALKENQKLTSDGFLLNPDGQLVRLEDHITMKGGQVFVVKDGSVQPATGPLSLGDGTVVQLDGTVRKPDGTKNRLLDGQILKMQGGALPSHDHVTLNQGRVQLQKDGALLTLEPGRTMTMSDGTKAMGDGTIVRPNGSRFVLKEGERLDLPGAKAARSR